MAFAKMVKNTSLIILTACFALTGCSSNGGTKTASTGTAAPGETAKSETASKSSGAKTKIEFWVPFTGPDSPFMKKIAENFNKSQDKFEVHYNNSNGTDYYNKFSVALTSGKDLPDAMVMHIDNVPVYKDKLMPIDDIAGKAGIKPTDYVEAPVKYTTFDGKWWAIPLDIHPLIMYYNKDLLKSAGVDKVPTTKDEFLDAAKKMTDESKKQYGYMVQPNDQWFVFATLLYQNGGKYTDDSGNPTFNSPEGVAAVQFEKSLIDAKISPVNVAKGGDETAFKQGKVGFIFAGPWMMDAWDQAKVNYGAAPIPQFGKEKAVFGGSHTLVIPNTTKDQKKLDGIAEFYKYIAVNGIEWAQSGQAPASKKILESDEFKKLTKQQTEIAKQFEYVKFPPQVPGFGANLGEMFTQLNLLLTGKKPDAKTALDEAATKYKQAAEKGKK